LAPDNVEFYKNQILCHSNKRVFRILTLPI
jgi:hypothetical protein